MSPPSLLLLALSLHSPAEANRDVTLGSSKGAKGFGLGIAIGDPTGLSLMWRPDVHSAVHVAGGWNTRADHVELHADYLWNAVRLRTAEAPKLYFPVFIGVGGRLQTYPPADYLGLGVSVPFGIGLVSESAPFDVLLELAPVVGLIPTSDVWLDGTLSGHFYF
jgi:hypothetical protein